MAIEVDTETNTLLPAEAGIFLEKPEPIYLASRDILFQSRLFADVNYDLLPQNVGNVLQAGIKENGELVSINEKQDNDVITLNFDAREKEKPHYKWQLSRANSSKRTVQQLDVSPEKIEGRKYEFDHQGALRNVKNLDQKQVNLLSKEVLGLMNHQLTRRNIEQLQAQKEIVTRQLGRYAVEALMKAWKPSNERYEAEKAKLEKRIHDIGFTPLTPYEPPKS